MHTLRYSTHAKLRTRQRGMRNGDVDLILDYGTQVDDEAWLLLDRDADRAIEFYKRQIQSVDRLRNRKVVVCGDHVVTAYPSRPADQKRTLRRGRQKGLAA